MLKKFSMFFLIPFVLVGCIEKNDERDEVLKNLNPEWLVSPEESYQWSSIKNENLPTFTGSPKWQNYLNFLETKLREYGVVDVWRNSWEFERWYTSDDDADWSLSSDGSSVRVANYGAYSGSTGGKPILNYCSCIYRSAARGSCWLLCRQMDGSTS